ncbi:MAG: dihydrolipoamide acetyltransferase family protein [Sedimentisphaerales bacterium]|jgi:pyruvate dehydrogenase E2 component (dihydrolipoamide acetyltransferase)
MAKEIRLPQLGQTMEEGTVVNCLVKAGDYVNKGDVIFEIETDKATLEMESPADGFVKHILVKTDQTLPVGEPLIVLGEENEEVPNSFIESLTGVSISEKEEVEEEASAEVEHIQVEVEIEKPKGRIMASPRAKKLAADLGVNLETVTGTGPGGKITEQDVKDASEKKPGAEAPVTEGEIKLGQTIPINRLQRLTAERMLKSKREIPCFYLTIRADVTSLVEIRNRLNQLNDEKLSYNDFIIKAVATGLEKYPIMTGQIDGDTIKLQDSINIALAISVPDGLVAPVLKNVGKKDIRQISSDSKVLIDKARSNKLDLTDLEGGCVTVSNLGAFGVDNFIPIVIPGQCSILGVGRITDTCVPDNGNILVRKMMNMTLSVDHKVANGAYAAQFMDFVHKLLEDPSTFSIE